MSWMERLAETYDNCQGEIGRQALDNPVLLPVGQTTNNVQIEVNLSLTGTLLWARALQKEEPTMIPCTETSGSRTSGVEPHPLFDKLQYIAGDYLLFGGKKGWGYEKYMTQLNRWCDSAFGCEELQAVRDYLQKGTLIADLVAKKVLFTDEAGRLLETWNGPAEDKPPIFRCSTATRPPDAFVRFLVEDTPLWQSRKLWDSFAAFYRQSGDPPALCFATGHMEMPARLSPAKLRNSGDKAKLISANDNTNFTFRGERFAEPQDAYCVGYETTQKAHNALRWLIERQGFHSGDLAVVVWGTDNQPLPKALPFQSTPGLVWSAEEEPDFCTEEVFAQAFNRALAGYRSRLKPSDTVVVMAVDAATTGRLAVTYYRELTGSALWDRIQKWHDPVLGYTYGLRMQKNKNTRSYRIVAAPSPRDIVLTAYGDKCDDKLKGASLRRLLPCIMDGRPLPSDLLRACVVRASRPEAMEGWLWRKTVDCTCALLRGTYNNKEKKERWKVAFNEKETDRGYLFGAAWACGEYLENIVLYRAGEARATNAVKLQSRFSVRPASTLKLLYDKLQPYIVKMGNNDFLKRVLITAMDKIPISDMTDAPLPPTYLLGYSAKLIDLNTKPLPGKAEH
ncbi:MAG: type I-C CRISPR-associated protein Cas8c/Csd1 [Clostridiales bacterium]|nr:type I-C CRISPR-associated protein Cas8c/Csd1 [Clostridiales bacterium]